MHDNLNGSLDANGGLFFARKREGFETRDLLI